ncbi:MAG: nodulation S family protein [Hydrococcus sp. Prado102]|jgi:SAM-dependent methyltransferase|nr:nodulation S family protein [Hydrococcus sp. Prado102]
MERKIFSIQASFWERKIKIATWAIALLSRGNLPLFSESRYVLELSIIPYFVARPDFNKILFVGCAWFTRYYSKEYFFARDYWTIDKNFKKAKYGAKQHIIDSLSNLQNYSPLNYFDLIICTGVFGWGLNEKEEVERAFHQCSQCLRPEGILILGWNDIPQRTPFPLESCQSLTQFKTYIFPPLLTSQYLTASRRRLTFNFYIK